MTAPAEPREIERVPSNRMTKKAWRRAMRERREVELTEAEKWSAGWNANMDAGWDRLAAIEASQSETLAEMERQHVTDAAFIERWNAMSLAEAIALGTAMEVQHGHHV